MEISKLRFGLMLEKIDKILLLNVEPVIFFLSHRQVDKNGEYRLGVRGFNGTVLGRSYKQGLNWRRHNT